MPEPQGVRSTAGDIVPGSSPPMQIKKWHYY